MQNIIIGREKVNEEAKVSKGFSSLFDAENFDMASVDVTLTGELKSYSYEFPWGVLQTRHLKTSVLVV